LGAHVCGEVRALTAVSGVRSCMEKRLIMSEQIYACGATVSMSSHLKEPCHRNLRLSLWPAGKLQSGHRLWTPVPSSFQLELVATCGGKHSDGARVRRRRISNILGRIACHKGRSLQQTLSYPTVLVYFSPPLRVYVANCDFIPYSPQGCWLLVM
jgi:hypothetical protein